LKYADACVAQQALGELDCTCRFLAATPGAGQVREELTDEKVRFR